MVGFLGEPTRLVMKPEKPDFFLSTEVILGSFDSSEKRFALSDGLEPCDFSEAAMGSAAEKLADCRNRPAVRASGVVKAARGMLGRLGDRAGDLVASMRLRMAEPSKGAPMNSSEALELRRRWVEVPVPGP